MLDVKQLLSDCEERMDMSVMHLEETLGHIRAGKANIHILDPIRVNSYGSHQQLCGHHHSRRTHHCHQALGQVHVPRY